MSATVRKAVASDLYPVYKLLSGSTLNARSIPLEERRRMFEPRWGGAEKYFGFVLEDDRIVGFLGLLFTTQTIGDRPHPCCELHSWYVQDEYRNDSIRLLMPALGLRGVTLLNYTPTKAVYDISVKFGFEDLEAKLLLVYPVPSPSILVPTVRVISERHLIAARLTGADKQVFIDHHDVRCEHLMLVDKQSGEECYLLFKRVQRKWYEPFGRVLYVTNKKVFLAALPFLRTYLCARYRMQCLALVYADFAEYSIPYSRVIDREVPSLIKSRDVKPSQVRPLYNLPLLIGYKLH